MKHFYIKSSEVATFKKIHPIQNRNFLISSRLFKYSILFISGLLCAFTTTYGQTQITDASFTVGSTQTICDGDNATLEIQITGVTSGDLTVAYNDGTTTFTPVIADGSPIEITVSPSSTTTYTLVSITDDNGIYPPIPPTTETATVTVNPVPAAPTATSPQSFCSINSPTIDDIAITGTNIIWYTAASGGSVVTAGTALVDGTTYYASQTVGGCESDTRRAVAVSVSDPAAPTATSPQSFCSINSPTIDDIAITGTNIIWYTAASGGSVVTAGTALVDGTTYYASQTVGGCESDTRRAVAVSVGDIAAPTATSPQSFCSINSPTIDDIAITGTNIIWYTAASGGSVVTAGTALVDGTTYYASQTVGGCESDTRRAVAVSVGDIAAPTATSPQSFCSINSPTIDDIAITGTNIIWYTAASGGSVVTAGTALVVVVDVNPIPGEAGCKC